MVLSLLTAYTKRAWRTFRCALPALLWCPRFNLCARALCAYLSLSGRAYFAAAGCVARVLAPIAELFPVSYTRV